jgi:endonuclease/exonuclease/phosphatase family metal-dependent hydrolase
MPHYWPLRTLADDTRNRAIDRLLALRAQLATEIGCHRSDGSLILATWNLRDFDSNNFGHGPRMPESFHYIAEIISTFDLVAVQEVHRDLTALRRLMALLGADWDYIVTDTTEGTSGNGERMAFLFDRRKVKFRNVAGEIVLPKGRGVVVAGTGRTREELQFARTPFMVSFQAGWFKFSLCTVHIFFGAERGAKLRRRVEEIRSLASFFARRQQTETEDYILLGDFNVVSPQHETMEALEREGFAIPAGLRRERSNLKGDKHYDQIALRVQEKRLEIGASGVFDFTRSVFRGEDFDAYTTALPQKQVAGLTTRESLVEYYGGKWRTWQMSDHLPMWVQLRVDWSDDYLDSLRPGSRPLAD